MHLTSSTITNYMASVYMCRHNNITKNDIHSYKSPLQDSLWPNYQCYINGDGTKQSLHIKFTMQNNSRTSDRANKEQTTKKQFPKEQEDIPSNLTLNHKSPSHVDGWMGNV